MGAPFIPKLIRYIEGCGEAGFGSRIRGADPALLAEFERLYGGPIPEDYLGYLRDMGGSAGGFSLYDKDDGGFACVVDYYRKGEDPFLPRGGSILVAIGAVEEIGIDGTLEGHRPVGIWADDRFESRLADSFEAYCFHRAWWLFRYPRFPHRSQVIIRQTSAAMLDAAAAAACRAGLDRQGFSDARHRMFDGEDTVCLRWCSDGELYVNAASQIEERAKDLAASIASAAG